ncbi:PH domain-containing protein [Oceanobacillus salinisoli]|uniref:PH domain-containing protein n=1 Tax=Oceanobacillus salinisoli TaxID=2678611 RepID=UPI0012E22B68|nr:PH domain-containing protein [Oceanobacillus salinisoli]
MFKAKRMHPATILFKFLQALKGWFFYFVIGFFAVRENHFMYFLLIVIAIVILLLTYSILSWIRFTYRIEQDELWIKYGVFIRKERHVSKNRIQSIDLTQGIIHRIFHLAKVQIETASGGTGAEISLQAVQYEEGKRIRREFKEFTSEVDSTDENGMQNNDKTYTITFKRLLLAGATSGSAGVILAFIGVAFSEMEQFIPEQFYDSMILWVIGLSIIFVIGLVIILFVVVWILGILGTVVKYWNFTITKNDEELFITRGLLEKKQLTVPIKRIQAVGMTESIIRQPFGYVTLFAEVAGSTLDQGEDFSTVLFPILRKGEVEEFLQHLIPAYSLDMKEITQVPKRGLKYYLIRASLFFVLLSAAMIYFLPQLSWVLILIFIAFLFLGYFRYKDAGFSLDKNRLAIRYRKLSKTTVMLYPKRIQALEKKQHILHQKEDLATLDIAIIGKMGAGKHYKLKELKEEDVHRLAEWYSREVRR